jgi:hypothetical protein
MPSSGGIVRVHAAPLLSPERDRPLLRTVDAVDHVEHRALARAVGPDDRAHLVLAHVERDIGERGDAAECERDVVELEDDVADAASRCAHAAARACAGNVFASAITRSAATVPARPSSNLHGGLDVLDLAPEYKASISTWYFSPTNPRRTLRVRGQLVVVRIELLVQDQEAMICEAARIALGGELAFSLLDALADELVHLRLAGEIGVARIRQARRSAQLPTEPMSMLTNAQTMSRSVPKGNRLLDVREELELVSR